MWVIDVLSRKSVRRHYALLDRSQWWPRPRLEELQVAKLRALLVHCRRHVPFYRDVMIGRGIVPERVTDLGVLSEFPVIDKATLTSDWRAFRSDSDQGLGQVRYSQTGGTTGEPLRVPKDAGVRSAAQAAMFRFHGWMGVGLRDRKVEVWGAALRPTRLQRVRSGLLASVLRTRRVDSFQLGPSAYPGILKLLMDWRPALVHGYCLSIADIAKWVAEQGCTVPLRAVSTTVEPLFEEQRRVIRAAFECDTFDQYACGESEATAMECAAHQGLHITEERVIVELGAAGEMLLTDLDNHAFPLIRYKNGDAAEPSDHLCSCGRQSRMLRRVLGRIGDVVVGANGQRLHPEFFTHLLNETGIAGSCGLRRYQVVQETAGRIVWRLVSQPLSLEQRGTLQVELGKRVGPMDIAIEVVPDLPASSSGKFRYVVNRA
jgi:phenylacetate-CoA ligase